jgi:hypothetical protein
MNPRLHQGFQKLSRQPGEVQIFTTEIINPNNPQFHGSGQAF